MVLKTTHNGDNLESAVTMQCKQRRKPVALEILLATALLLLGSACLTYVLIVRERSITKEQRMGS